MPQRTLTPEEFVQRWAGRPLNERAAAQSHFNDLCDLLGVPKPTDNRVDDSNYGFEAKTDISASGVYATRNAEDGSLFYQVTTGSGPGFADVWKRGCFGWEYKGAGKHATLNDALAQLRIYAASLGNPPLLIVSDIDRYEIHTNFTNYPDEPITFRIEDFAKPSPEWKQRYPSISPIAVLRKIFDDNEAQWFKPEKTRQAITAEFAEDMGELAIALRDAGNDPHAVAHLIMQIVFCFFAEDIGLLPKGLFADLIDKCRDKPRDFPPKARALFKAMEFGGNFGNDTIEWFNGGLFKDVDRDPTIQIDSPWLGKLLIIAKRDWDSVDPSIFGTLFERSLDPGKRSQIGAHYTSREDIMLIVEPVVMQPLRRQWVDVQKDVAEWLEQRREAAPGGPGVSPGRVPDRESTHSRAQSSNRDSPGRDARATGKGSTTRQRNLSKKIQDAITAFVDHLGSIKILDPACGSGNFLYVTIQQLLDLENEVRAFAARPEINVAFLPRVQPRQLMGIDVNDYACELARVSIWIGYLQWLHANGSAKRTPPILDPLDTIEHRDAILKWVDEKGKSIPVWQPGAKCVGRAEWPKADFIIGNPPFLGNKLFRHSGLGEPYIRAMYEAFDLPHAVDLCCYWFEDGMRLLSTLPATRVGLLATAAIRAGANREVLDRIKKRGDIFMAWSDRRWILDGAAVRVALIGFDTGLEPSRFLDGAVVAHINADLTSTRDFTSLARLAENEQIAFQGPVKVGDFDIPFDAAKTLLTRPNPHLDSNLTVMKLWMNASDIAKRARGIWIIDFEDMSLEDASRYEGPFDHVQKHVRPFRARNNDRQRREQWWRLGRSAGELRSARRGLSRVLITPRVATYRSFVWADAHLIPDSRLFLFAREDDYFLGILQSSVHELWTLTTCSWHGVGNDPTYNTSTCFETFSLPWPPGKEPASNPHYKAIAAAAKELNELRENWLNPPEWIKPIEDAVDRFEDFTGVRPEAVPLLRQSAIMARAAKDAKLKKRTLTNLYNERPGWLKIAHRKLDEAVLAAYAAVDPAPPAPNPWDPSWAAAYEPFGAGEITIVKKGKKPDPPEVVAAKEAAIAQRKVIDEKILANLLRLNQQRAAAAHH